MGSTRFIDGETAIDSTKVYRWLPTLNKIKGKGQWDGDRL